MRELWVVDAVKLTMRTFRSPSIDGYRDVHDLSSDEVAMPRIAPAGFALKLSDLKVE